jgi:ATP-dependent DNA ligase
MEKVTLYQLSGSTGKVKVWSIEVIDKGDHSLIEVFSGQQGGKQAYHPTKITEGKSIGRSNETSHYTQALADAQSTIDRKKKDGYCQNIDNIKSSAELGTGIPQPMLANKYDPTGKQSGSKTLNKFKIYGKDGFTQRKYDGVRQLTKITTIGATMYTRKGEPSTNIQFIADNIHSRYMELRKNGIQLPDELWLDGEAFTDVIEFEKLGGLVRKETLKPGDREILDQFNLYLYDVINDKCYSERINIIELFTNVPGVVIVESEKVVLTDDVLREKLEKYLDEGHEGLMIRQIGIPYENKRTNQLIKYKLFQDSEFTIVGGKEGRRKGHLGTFTLKMDHPAHDRDGKLIETFEAAPKNISHEDLRNFLVNIDKFVGRKVTVEYFERTSYGVPRFPKAKGVRYDL